MTAEYFLAGAIVLQVGAACAAFRLIRVTGQSTAWILISIALVLMAVRRIIPFARAVLGAGAVAVDPVNEGIGLALSGLMLAGIVAIGPIFRRIFRSAEELKASARLLRNSVREKEALLRELHHRTKNNMQIISSLLDLESAQCGDPRMAEEFHLIEDRIQSMSLVHDKLYVSRDLSCIDLYDYIEDLSSMLLENHGEGRVSMATKVEHVLVPIDTAIPFGLILDELLTNAFRHAFPDGRSGTVEVVLSRKPAGLIELEVRDDGAGVGAGFDAAAGPGMGLKTVLALAGQLGGSVGFDDASGFACAVSFGDHRMRGGIDCCAYRDGEEAPVIEASGGP